MPLDNLVWEAGTYRVFISYASAQEELVKNLKHELRKYSISAFVAADNIQTMENWQKWIEYALTTTNYVVAVVTCEFHKSLWANQEVGFAYARNIPITSIKYGANPDGFIKPLQAIDCTDNNAAYIASKIFQSMLKSYTLSLTTWNILVNSYAQNPNAEQASHVVNALSQAKSFSPEQEQKLVAAINSSQHVYNSTEFLGTVTNQLETLTGNIYALYAPTPRHQQLIRIDPNSPAWGYTGQYCTIPGTYFSQCRPDVLISLRAGDRFPPCGIPNQHYYHAAYWFLYHFS